MPDGGRRAAPRAGRPGPGEPGADEPAPNALSGAPLDRAAGRRADAAWFAAALADPATRVVPVCEGRVLVAPADAPPGSAAGARGRDPWAGDPWGHDAWGADAWGADGGLRAATVAAGALRDAAGAGRPWPDPERAAVLLGIAGAAAGGDVGAAGGPAYGVAYEADAGTAYVAVDVAPGDADRVSALAAPAGAARWTELRPAALAAAAPDAALLAYARGMVWWHTRHRFCGVCGGPTASAEAGHVRPCTRCDARHFPRTDPAVIVLVAHAEPGAPPAGEACLLGSAPGWPEGVYSTLAGFVEPGESLEEAVRREVWEEAGVRVGGVRYASSQPWPLPQSLMLGFTARAAPGTRRDRVRPDPAELRDARWFTRAELADALAGGRVRLPSPLSIARRLIDEWRAAPPAHA